MHVERVEAHAFGPLQGDTLELGPGCNVIHGPNESGKSSWHTALTTALGGRRRGRGRPAAEQDFADRHRPWSGGRWAVGARLRLADGRLVTIHQDLDDPSRCQAHDQSGRPVLDEILTDGMPDASRWLGLDREAFRACASVRQADVARLEGDATALQHYLQQAATTRKAESTAGAALDRLRSFKGEAVGTDRRNAVKPLRRALDRSAAAEHAAGGRDRRARVPHRCHRSLRPPGGRGGAGDARAARHRGHRGRCPRGPADPHHHPRRRAHRTMPRGSARLGPGRRPGADRLRGVAAVVGAAGGPGRARPRRRRAARPAGRTHADRRRHRDAPLGRRRDAGGRARPARARVPPEGRAAGAGSARGHRAGGAAASSPTGSAASRLRHPPRPR